MDKKILNRKLLIFCGSLLLFFASAVSALADNYGSLGSWSTTTVMVAPRAFLSSVVNNGYVYAIGGRDASNTATSSVLFAPISSTGSIGSWSTTTPMLAARALHASVVNNNYVYALGGKDTSGIATSSVIYALINSTGSLGSWSNATAMPSSTFFLSSVVNNGYIYAIGGQDAASALTSSVLYALINSTGSLGSWSNANAMPAARGIHASVVNNGYIYALGGDPGGGIPTSSVVYALANSTGSLGSWSTATNAMPAGRKRFASVANKGYVYAVGGLDTNNIATSSVVYAPLYFDGSIGSWSSVTTLPSAISVPASVVNNGYIYALGGQDASSTATSTVIYASITPPRSRFVGWGIAR